MAYAPFLCLDEVCGYQDGFRWFTMQTLHPPCPRCGKPLEKNWADMHVSIDYQQEGEFQKFYSFAAGRDFETHKEWRDYEKDLNAKGLYVRGGPEGKRTPLEQEHIRNVEKHGEAYLTSEGVAEGLSPKKP